jgi:ribosomal protein S18 acetylase RimI-like enzyme
MAVTTRAAGPEDATAITETVSTAFFEDPVWSWAFPDPALRSDQYSLWWPLWIEAGLRKGSVWVTPGCEAATVWTTPGVAELSETEVARVEPLVRELLGARADDVLEGIDRFDAAHPHDEPHWYLSVVATHTDHRGAGLGFALLEGDLARIDGEHMPAYLESSNPANLDRYRRLGFVERGEFSLPADGPTVTTMWRTAR